MKGPKNEPFIFNKIYLLAEHDRHVLVLSLALAAVSSNPVLTLKCCSCRDHTLVTKGTLGTITILLKIALLKLLKVVEFCLSKILYVSYKLA